MFQCGMCLRQYPKEPKRLMEYRSGLGCFGVKRKPIHSLGDYLYSTCPGNFVLPQLPRILTIYKNYERGIMPFGGPLMNQTVKIIEIFDVIESYKADKAKRDNMANRHRSNQRGGK